MEYFGVIGFILAVVFYCQTQTLSAKVKKMEAYLKELGYVDKEKESLQAILKKNVGRRVKLQLTEDYMDYDINNKECIIIDMDETWLKVTTVKKQEEYLIQLEGVKSANFPESAEKGN